MTILFLVTGVAFLSIGAEFLVRGASRLAASLRVTPLVIGLTLVAFGTSAPELVVSVQSSLHGQADIAIGNVVGSNIFNVLFILGICAAITPLKVAQQLLWWEVPIMIGTSCLLLVLSFDGNIDRQDAIALLCVFVAYVFWSITRGRKQAEGEKSAGSRSSEDEPAFGGVGRNTLFVVCGLVMLVFGSSWFVSGAVAAARYLGVSELVIGLTMVSVGTSLPEVATSIVAAFRGEPDIAVGNVVGSNVFNVLAVVGVAGLLPRQGIDVSPALLDFDIPVMIAVSIACLPIFFTGHAIARWEGFLFLGYYGCYLYYLTLGGVGDAARWLSTAVTLFVLPLTAATLAIAVLREIRARRRRIQP